MRLWLGGGAGRVAAAHDLAAFVPLRAADLKLEAGKAEKDEFSDARALLSHYALTELKQGAVFRRPQVSGGTWDPDSGDAQLMEIPLKPGWHFDGWKFPVKAVLVASPREPETGHPVAATLPVVVIGSGKTGNTIWVSVAAADAQNLKSFEAVLGSSEIYAQAVINSAAPPPAVPQTRSR